MKKYGVFFVSLLAASFLVAFMHVQQATGQLMFKEKSTSKGPETVTMYPPSQMQYILHKASSRGETNVGWLVSRHTFSFNDYYDPDRMNFGALRVVNDDFVDGGRGFPNHAHNNMEIISIPLEGAIRHRDNTGKTGIIHTGDVQIMSAGKGIIHSEENHSLTNPVRFLQIWVLPNSRYHVPSYQQIKGILTNHSPNTFKKLLAPNDNKALFINQNAVFSMGKFSKGKKTGYKLAFPGNGVYAFIIEGSAIINGVVLNRRDGLGIWNTENLTIEPSAELQILLMDVPIID
jgi:redox-sensitive bicupin YhaK (pirin superfamily)